MKVKDIYDWIDNCTCHDPDILHEIKQLLTQKRVVSMKWVWELEELFIGYRAGNPISLILDKLKEQGIEVEEEEEEEREQEPMDKETVGDMEYHRLKDEGRLDRFGRRKWDE